MSNPFHLTLITVLLFLVFMFNLPGLSGFPKVIRIGVSLSCVLGTPCDLPLEHLVAKLLLDLGSNWKNECHSEKEKSMDRP